ncbi:hypothetical protein FZC74_12085 [Sutcliffiella horikoshii]|uniref:Uncharacterized protein n=1 Tax=Sutcliffiella horikoshii TaxID=79883 RepID=A0AA94WQ17_9BACI|nr:hypothetical protein [Sutcliffiella horikoshii]TYS58538.1 hypothetical protein FZC74_12085 [Sutcliffiella horikoshii]
MNLKLEKFVMQESIKKSTKELLDAENEVVVYNVLKEISSIGDLKKVKILLQCQKEDITNNFTTLAIFITTLALLLPAIDKSFVNLQIYYIVICFSLVTTLIHGILKTMPLLNTTKERNRKIEYLLWMVDEELILRK